jgi:hypothetical protein
MKPIYSLCKALAAVTLATLAAGCATSSSYKSKEEIAIAADFKVIKPTRPDQKAILERLPADRVSKITYGGKTYYVLPDKADQQAYVGGPKQYASYQQLGQAKEAAAEYEEADAVRKRNQKGSSDWSGWDGWDDWAGKNGQNAVSNSDAANGWY